VAVFTQECVREVSYRMFYGDNDSEPLIGVTHISAQIRITFCELGSD